MDESSTILQNAGQLDWPSFQRQPITSPLSQSRLGGFRQDISSKPSIHPFTYWANTYWTSTIVRSKLGNPYNMFSKFLEHWGQITLGKSDASLFQVSFSTQKELRGITTLESSLPLTYCTLKGSGEWTRLVNPGKTHWSCLAELLPFFLRVSHPHEDAFSLLHIIHVTVDHLSIRRSVWSLGIPA